MSPMAHSTVATAFLCLWRPAVNVCFSRDCAALGFWRSQESFRHAPAQLQSCADPLLAAEQNDHVGPHQRAGCEFAGGYRRRRISWCKTISTSSEPGSLLGAISGFHDGERN